jgi:hypothetical protein
MLPVGLTARNRHAESNSAAHAACLQGLVQKGPALVCLMTSAPVAVEMSELLAAVLGSVGLNSEADSEVTTCHAAMVRKARKPETGG